MTTPPVSQTTSHGVPLPAVGDKRRELKLAIAALGVVYGDIGTSPLYSVRECFTEPHGVGVTRNNVLGVLSLVFWSLMLIISVKYLLYILRADNKGEGGILALTALASSSRRVSRVLPGAHRSRSFRGVAPLRRRRDHAGDFRLERRRRHPYRRARPLGLGHADHRSSFWSACSRSSGAARPAWEPCSDRSPPLWFTSLALLGGHQLIQNPEVLLSVNPVYAVSFLVENGHVGLIVLGSVFLVVTGGEALYADLGHFGRHPIRVAWFSLVLPSLLLNYMGQGALLLEQPDAKENPFYRMVPEWGIYPMVVLSTAATIIASQALITGVYSLTRQAIMLGLLPRLSVRHTSADERGQIYVPSANWILMLLTIGLVLEFKTSSNLAAAYGIAATLTMMTTTVLAFFLTRYGWGWSLGKSLLVTAFFLVPEVAFVSANVAKIAHGGWFPLTMGALICATMLTWKRGREILAQRFREQLLPLADFFELIRVELPARVPGTAVFMTSSPAGTPPALLQNLMHNRVIHQRIVLMRLVTSDSARVNELQRFELEELGDGFCRVTGHYGFMEQPDVPKLLIDTGIIQSVEHVTFFLGRENLIVTDRPGMAKWRVALFSYLARNAQPVTKFFNIPPDRVVEMGAQIAL